MDQLNHTFIRKTALIVATAIAISVPGIGAAGLFNRTQTRKQNGSKTVAEATVSLPDVELIEIMKVLNLKEILQNIIIMQPIQTDYHYISDGSECVAECVNYRIELRGLMNDLLSLIDHVPILNTDNALIGNLKNAMNLVDYMPPRAMYLLWKTLGGQLEHIRASVIHISQGLAPVPPLDDFTVFNDTTYTYETMSKQEPNNESSSDIYARSAFEKPFVDFFQARLEMLVWRLHSLTNSGTDIEVRSQGSVTTAVSTKADISLSPGDQGRNPLQLIAFIPDNNQLLDQNQHIAR